VSVPRFLTDEDLHGPIIRATRRLEPSLEIVRVVDVGLAHSDDSAVLEYATTNELLLVSHDVNTMKAAAERRIAAGQGISGLFLVPQGRPTRETAESLLLIWAGSQAEEWRDRIVYLPL
jgi:hypothetical protein